LNGNVARRVARLSVIGNPATSFELRALSHELRAASQEMAMTPLYDYLGAWGLAAACCWAVALIVRGLAERSRRPVSWLAAALLAAVAALGLGYAAAHRIAAIEIDRSAERKAEVEEKKRLREQARRVIKQRAAKVRFAEDNPDEQLDLAGIKKVDQPVIAAATMEVEEAQGPTAARVLPEPQVWNARRLGELNVVAAWAVLLVILASLAGEYLDAYRRDPLFRWPLPLASRLQDAVLPACASGPPLPPEPERRKELLERLVRRGELFIYIGGDCPLQPEGLARWVCGPWKGRPLALKRMTDGDLASAEPLLQSVHDGRQALVVDSAGAQEAWLEAVVRFLRVRCRVQARAVRTVNLVWAGAGSIPPALEPELGVLCSEANFRLLAPATTWSAEC
jgi:hypothetical protein